MTFTNLRNCMETRRVHDCEGHTLEIAETIGGAGVDLRIVAADWP
ncbi:MAG: hypothetical protein NT172_06100 [Planctomycetota bacterium]|nr:hypothetical protein [Planctomycetota bacterium]